MRMLLLANNNNNTRMPESPTREKNMKTSPFLRLPLLLLLTYYGSWCVLVVDAWLSPSSFLFTTVTRTKSSRRARRMLNHYDYSLPSSATPHEDHHNNPLRNRFSWSLLHSISLAPQLQKQQQQQQQQQQRQQPILATRRTTTVFLQLYHRSGENANDNDDQDEEEYDDDDDDDEPPEVDTSQFQYSTTATTTTSQQALSFGYNKGRSSPSQRKAMGRSSSSVTHVHLCTNCGSEFVKWMGRCPTCKQWNTLQEHVVQREAPIDLFGGASSGGIGRPVFGSQQQHPQRPHSWLDGILQASSSASLLGQGAPVRITDLYLNNKNEKDNKDQGSDHYRRRRRERIVIPNDDEFNTVLGGGIMPGSLILVGGDPGVGKSTLLLQTAGAIATHLSQPTLQPGMGLPKPKTPLLPTSLNKTSSTTAATPPPPLGPVWYCSGEESPDQIASRAQRLGIDSPELWIWSETHADSLCAMVVQQMQLYEQARSSSSQQQQQQKQQQQQLKQDNDEYNNDHDGSDRQSSSSSSFVLQALPPSLLIVDSIQTMVCTAAGPAAAGGITQVRECVALFLRLAKSTGLPIFLVGHVTKSGDVAGPRTVEHMVDGVLYLEGSSSSSSSTDSASHRVRLLRASKNRFGSNEEVGVYEMTGGGGGGRLLPVSDPSSLFLSHRRLLLLSDDGEGEEDAEGCAIAIVLEGMRAIAVEVQALVAQAGGGAGNSFGRRTVQGMGTSRLMLLLGVLQKRCEMPNLARFYDIYVNLAGGGIRLDRGGSSGNGAEGHAADLATAIALVSSYLQIGVRADTAFVGEVGLLGELRPVASMEKRLQEARRMGFSRVISPPPLGGSGGGGYKKNNHPKPSSLPRSSTTATAANNVSNNNYRKYPFGPSSSTPIEGVEWIQCRRLYDAIQAGLVQPIPTTTPKSRTTASSNSSSSKTNNKSGKQSNDSLLSGLGLQDIRLHEDDDIVEDENNNNEEGAFM